ncbi:MAG: D-alanyl-D-alanine carboxypeptidase [Acutalibacteraceae bacterium]
MIDADTGAVIAQRNGDERIYPASLTKIMTALIAIGHTDNLNQA